MTSYYMVTSIASREGGGIDVRHVCHYFRVSGHKSFVYIHTPISREVETARPNMFGNTAHDVHDAKVYISLRASKPDVTAPFKRAYTSQTYTRYRHPKVCP